MTVPTGFPLAETRRYDVVSLALTAIALFAVLELGLLAAFLAGVLVYELVHVVAPLLLTRGLSHRAGKAVALALLSLAFVLLLAAAIAGVTSLLTDSSDNVVVLLRKMADVVQTGKNFLPVWVHGYIPESADEWQKQASQWLRENAGALQSLGENFGRILFHIIVGAVIGGLAALGPAAQTPSSLPPLRGALLERAQLLGTAFRRVVFAQVRISALNTILTGFYLAIILPALGVHLPLVKTMIAVTFIAGLLPVIGNLISNTVIVIVSLGMSAYAAIGSLIFLVLIHKLEYFVNARIIGTQIRSRAWELLVAMLVMEAWFGIPGIIAAPIYYSYIKDELSARKLI
ncbi:MAG: AI-2E family transporter [Parvibaculum sp.]|uniref:AI-2E family transporter n=1 Tax=Parvibaculum sp. TaxID=2024848 RepID=UPI0025DB7EB5|nr:AI-2E family transporter [Parvibaculum sp.]MCE9650879.1 AI-2E family transporter [Parvibaculum sp.]